MAIKVKFYQDRFGSVIAEPVREDIKNAIVEYLAGWKIDSNGTALIESEADLICDLFLTTAQKRDLDNGWTVTVLVDPWYFLNLFGWDICEAVVVEPRKAYVQGN